MPPHTHCIVMLAKAPLPGKVKTRLNPTLTPQHSAHLHAAFLLDLGATLSRLQSPTTCAKLCYAGERDHPIFVRLEQELGLQREAQAEGDLGERLSQCALEQFQQGAAHVLLIGSDSPTLTPEHFQRAFDALEQGADVVIGPSFDGGYYLIGMSAWDATIFSDIAWSTPRVLEQTVRRCHEAGLGVKLLEFWYDVDEVEDLRMLRGHFEYLAHLSAAQYSETQRILESLEHHLDPTHQE